MNVSPAQRTDWPLVLLLFGGGLLASAQFGKITLLLEPVGAAYGFPPARAALAVSMLGIVGILLGVVAGGVVARHGVRRVLLAALGVGGAVSLAQAVLPPWPVLLALRVVEGFAHLAIVVAAPPLMAARANDAQRPLVMGLWGMFFGVGFALLAVILPPLMSAGGLPAVFAAHGAAMLALALLLAPRLPRRDARERGTAGAGPAGFVRQHAALYGSAPMAAPSAIFFWHTLMFVGLLAVLPGLLGGGAWVAAALPLVSLAGTFAAGALARRVAPVTIGRWAFLGSLLISPALLLPGALPLAAAFALIFTVGLIPGAAFAAIPHYNASAPSRALASGGLAQVGNLGTTATAPLFAGAVAVAGQAGLAALTAAIAAAGLVVLGLIARSLRSPAPAPL